MSADGATPNETRPPETRSMTALDAILTRNAALAGNLREPGPRGFDLETLLNAAACAPDHGWLRPWRFLLIEGEARRAFGDVIAASYAKRWPEMDEPSLQRVRRYPMRIPLFIGVIASVKESRIPAPEQVLSAGAAAQNIVIAAHALGYGAMWISSMIEDDPVAQGAIGLASHESCVGWITLGSLKSRPKQKKRPRGLDFTRVWLAPGETAPADGMVS